MKHPYTRKQIEQSFEKFPDVVDLKQFREMLGGISDGVARKLMQGQYVEHFVIGGTYMIPKPCVVDYVMSKHYQLIRLKLKHQIRIPDMWSNRNKEA